MPDDPPARLLFVVVGSSLRAEEVDRPLGYFLKQKIEQAWAEHPERGALQVLVISDVLWLHDKDLHPLPTISVGGPGVNALAHHWWDEQLPLALDVDKRYFVQMDPSLDEPRASVWGMDNATTQLAVAMFVEHFLHRFLEHCAAMEPYLSDPDDDD